MIRKIIALLFLTIIGMTVTAAPSDDAAFEKKLMTIRIPNEVDFKQISLSDAMTNISKSSNVTLVAAADIADLKLDLYFPANQTLRKIIDTIKSTNGLVEEIRGDTLILMKRPNSQGTNTIRNGKVVGKVTEIDKITGIRGVTLTLGDDMSTLVLSDVGGAFIIDNVKPGSYILKAVAKGYNSNAEIIEVKAGEDTKINLILAKAAGKVGGTTQEAENTYPVADKQGNKRMSKLIEVTYGDPQEIADVIKPIVYLESIVVDPKSNVLLLVGNEDNINTAQQLIRKLDVGTKQIRIKAKIWDVNKTTANDLGIAWDAETRHGSDFIVDKVSGKYTKDNFVLNFGNFADNPLAVSLKMLTSINEAQVIAEPMVATMNGESADIQVVDEEIVGYTETASSTAGGASTKTPLFKSAGVVLTVKPTIKTDKTILIDFSSKVSRFSKEAVYSSAVEKKSETKTKIKVRNGETLRIGGLVRRDINKGVSKVPLLGDIPLLGVLFQNSTTQEVNRDLWVELTTEIIE